MDVNQRKVDILYKLRVMRKESPGRSVTSMLKELRLSAVKGKKANGLR